jgi:hypothetical protein
MKPSIQTLGHILYSPSQYVIPVFQRNYRWERLQWSALWESLQEIQLPEKRGNHFMGFLVFVPGVAQPGQHTRFYLVDGQQRLATLSGAIWSGPFTTLPAAADQQQNDSPPVDARTNRYSVWPKFRGMRGAGLVAEQDRGHTIAFAGVERTPKAPLGRPLRRRNILGATQPDG